MINLAMDTLAAIAFGSEPVLEEYMKERPVPRRENILTKNMMVEILIGAFYITGICLSILFVPAVRNLFGDVDITYLKSALFATFMMAITFNGFNARTEHVNPFEHIGRNKNFLLVMGTIFLDAVRVCNFRRRSTECRTAECPFLDDLPDVSIYGHSD